MVEPTSSEVDPRQAFAKALGDAIREFLEHNGMQKAEIAEKFGLESRQVFHSYLRDQKHGRRVPAPAYVFYLACTQLGFKFDYEGYRISAKRIKGKGKIERMAKPSDQYTLSFGGNFELADKAGALKVSVKRPPERLELFVSVNAKAS